MNAIDRFVNELSVPFARSTHIVIIDSNDESREYFWNYARTENELRIYETHEDIRRQLFKGAPAQCRALLENDIQYLDHTECFLHAWIRKGCPPLGYQLFYTNVFNPQVVHRYRAELAMSLLKDELLCASHTRITNNTLLQSDPHHQVVPLVHS